MGYIYVITNQINGKQYVGQTKYNIESRWKRHLLDSKKNNNLSLYKAFEKYNIENFKIEILEQCDNLLLDDKEKFWIAKLNTYSKGYNMTLGGLGNGKINHQEVINLYQKLKNQNEVARQLNISPWSVHEILKANDINIISQNKIIEVYDLNKNFLQSFNSILSAAEWLKKEHLINSNIHTIRRQVKIACETPGSTRYNFQWIYKGDLLTELKNKPKNNCKKVGMYNLNNELIKNFNSIKEAANYIIVNLNSNITLKSAESQLGRIFKKDFPIAYNFIWRKIGE